MPAAADIVHLSLAGILVEMPEGGNQVVAVDIVAHLLALVAEDGVGPAGDGAPDQVGEKAVQFGARMGRACQAAAAEGAGLQTEVATVFLGHDIGGHLGSAKDAVLGLVDAHALVDAEPVEGVRFVQLPSRFLFNERQGVGAVAVDLVGAGEKEGRLRAELAGGFQQDQGAVGVDGEVGDRLLGRPVVRRLGGGVDDQIDICAVFLEQAVDPLCAADVDIAVAVVLERRFELFPVPPGRPVLAEEILPHIVIDADDIESLCVKVFDRFAADQTGRTGNNRDAHIFPLILV